MEKIVVNITKGKSIVRSTNPDWQAYQENSLDPDTPFASVPEMIFQQTTKVPTVLQMLRHVLWVNKFRVIGNSLYFYNYFDGYYEKIDEAKERLCVNQFFSPRIQQLIGTSSMKEVISRLKNIPHLQMDYDDLDSDPDLINVKNGVLRLSDGVVLPKSHAFYFSYCLNVEYHKLNARWELCPAFQKFCNTSLEGKAEKTTQLLEVLGYLWSKVWGAKAAFMFVGEANCGKSVILDLVKYVVGSENVSHIPLHKLGDRFSIATLSGKALNICAEIKSVPLRGIDIFKEIVSGDMLQAEFKGKDLFSFRCRTKLLFAGNSMPSLAEIETSQAFLCRLKFLTFPHEIPYSEQDHQLLDKLIDERHAIFSLTIAALRELISRNLQFSESAESVDFMKDYTFELNHMSEFIAAHCEEKPEEKVATAHLYERYAEFCKQNCLSPLKMAQFSQAFKRTANVQSAHFRSGGSPIRGFEGIQLRNIF